MEEPRPLGASEAGRWTDAACRDWVWRLRFSPDGAHAECPSCRRRRRFHRLAGRPAYSCDACGHQLAPTGGTLFARSSTSLALWFGAVVVLARARERGEPVSVRRLARETGLGYGAARHIRECVAAALDADAEAAAGGVPPDESARIVRRILSEYGAGRPGWELSPADAQREGETPVGEPLDAARPSGRAGARRGRAATRERILGATCRVIVAKGMAAVRVSDIAREAGLSTAIVHYHFATKDEVLLEAVVWQNARETRRRAEIVAGDEPALERLWRFLEASMPPHGFAREEGLIRYDLWGKAMRDSAYQEVLQPLRREWRAQIITLLEEGVTAGEFRLAVPFDQLVEELTAILDGYSLQYLLGYEWMTAERLWDLLAQLLGRHLGVSRAALESVGRASA
jgi:AcrR family transcriptional regulator/transposase-like protein